VGYLGYGLRAGVEGFKSGFNMGQMKWQQNEKKRLEKKQEELNQAATVFNQMVSQMGDDGAYSEDDMMKINTSYMALGYDVKERVDGTYKAIQAMDKKTIEDNEQWFDYVIESTSGMTSADAQGIFDTVKPFVTGEKGLKMFEALESISKKKKDIKVEPQPEDYWKQAGVLPQDYRPGYLQSKGIDIPQPATAPEQPQTELDKQTETDKWLDSAYKSGNANYFNQIAKQRGSPATFDTYKQGYEKPPAAGEAGAVEEPEPETVSTLKNWETMFNIKAKEGPKTEEEYNRALDLLAQSKDNYKPKYASWKEALISEVKGIAKELEGITDKGDRTILLNVYKQKLEEIKAKYPEVNLSQFPEFEEQKNWFDKLKEKVGL